jgi:hypothetical protein
MWRSRWSAIGAAVAVSFGAGGLLTAGAASPESVFVAIEPTRVLDTRIDVGLVDGLVDGTGRVLDVTGTIPVVLPGNVAGMGSPVPDGATAIVANVTAVFPSTAGFVAVRPGNATGVPTTSNINFTSGGVIEPNSVTVELPTSGAQAGAINVFFRGTNAAATTDLLVDIVGYYTADTPTGVAARDTIPSGLTVTGVFFDRTSVSTAGQPIGYMVQLPALTPVDLAATTVGFAPTPAPAIPAGEEDATCTGTWTAPTAPSGKLCIYVADALGFQAGTVSAPPLQPFRNHGFVLKGLSDGVGVIEFDVTWAYTAP